MSENPLWEDLPDLFFGYYRASGEKPFPRTFATALRGFRNGQIPITPVLFRSGSAESIYQQPLNIHLVLDLMANAEYNDDVNQALGEVLFENLGDPDREIADFAAQALARLEERYYKRMQTAEEHHAAAPDHGTAGTLAHLYMAFAELQRFNPMLRGYYLEKVIAMDEDLLDPILRARALVDLDRMEEAREVVLATHREGSREGQWILAEIAFSQGDYQSIAALLTMPLDELTAYQQEVRKFWGVEGAQHNE